MNFFVSLIKTAEIAALAPLQVFSLCNNARHIAGDYWLLEGDPGSIGVECEVINTAVTEAYGDMDSTEFIEHCERIFSVPLSDEDEWWEILGVAMREGWL